MRIELLMRRIHTVDRVVHSEVDHRHVSRCHARILNCRIEQQRIGCNGIPIRYGIGIYGCD